MNILFLAMAIIGISVTISTTILIVYMDRKRNINDQFDDTVKRKLHQDYKKKLRKELDKYYLKN